MLRSMLLAVVPMILVISTVNADETISLDLASISDAAIEIEEGNLGDLDVDALANQADGGHSEDAVEACFRRVGYRSRGWGSGYRCYRPYYSYRVCYPTYYCYRPTYYYSYPTTSCYSHYWGCY